MALITDNEYKMKKNKVTYGVIVAALSVGIIVQIFPFIWLISSSLKGVTDIFELPPRLIPKTFHFENYAQVFELLPLGRYFYNTMFIAALTIVLQIGVSTLAAYSLSKLKPLYGRAVLLFFLATMMIPEGATIIPRYLMMIDFPVTGGSLINSPWSLILPGAAWAWPIFLMKGFFDGLPNELFEAMKVDGASRLRTLFSLLVPLSKPIFAICILQTFLGVYNQFIIPLVMMPDSKQWTLMVAIYNMQASGNFGWHLIMVLLVISTIPLLVAFLFAQKYLVQGISMTGLKG